MDVFFYLAVVLLSSALLAFGVRRKSKPIIGASLLLPMLYSGLRVGVGTDFDKYVLMYNEVVDRSFGNYIAEYAVEPTFYFLAVASKFLFDNPFLIFLVFSILTVIFFYKGLVRHVDKVSHIVYGWIFYLLVVFPNKMNISRQGLAISIAFYAFTFIPDRQFKKYLAWMLVAILFHYSTAILLPAYFLNRVITKRRSESHNKLRVVVLSAFLAVVIPMLALLAVRVLPVSEKYADYVTSSNTGANILFFIFTAIIISCSLLVTLYKKPISYKKQYIYLYSMIAAALLFAGFFIGETRRISLYFIPYIGLLIPMAISMMTQRLATRFAWIIAVAYALGYFVMFYVVLEYGEVFPYNTIFTQGY